MNVGYAHPEYDAVLGKATDRHDYELTETLEGEVTRILYRAPEGRSSLEVRRNYTSELAAAGLETRFSCRADDCGEYFYVREQGVFTRTGSIEDAFVPEPPMRRYVAARLARRGEGDVYVFLFVGESNWSPISEGTYAHLDVVEIEPMDTNIVPSTRTPWRGTSARPGASPSRAYFRD